jgi:hypothetical protein
MVTGGFTSPVKIQRYTAAGAVDGAFTSGITGVLGVQLLDTPGYCLLAGNFSFTATSPAGDFLHAYVH